MAPRTAQEEVFSIPELFSEILLHLPMLDLFLSAPLVNHSWSNLIGSSPSLQASLFFHPRPHHPRRKPEINHLLQAAFRPWFHNRPLDYCHPFLMFTSLDWNQSDAKRAAYSRKEASWRRMLPVQPPPRTVEVVKLTYGENQQFENRGELRFEDGVRMGTLYDLGYQTVMQPASSFWISWHMFPDMDCQDFGWGCWSEDEDEEFENEILSENGTITFTVSMTLQGSVEDRYAGRYVLGPELRSQGYEERDIEFRGDNLLTWDPSFDADFNGMWSHEHNYGVYGLA